ncbi:TIGR04206 family protein [Halorussus salilacus]|uniref:TIGR04206 family protein n=1 Tax=Halorussus salilacus TaxID=2953750 RepID=UPI00209F0D10|nr:TIGR04206 family protein [Halorussus salilacus]USZ68626.1 TIGR04206 family protein [Halorussus salilacus]
MSRDPRGTDRDSAGVGRLLALLGAVLVPWTAFFTGDFVFAWGLVSADPFHVTTLPDYLYVHTAGLPDRLLAWPVAVLLYLLAVGSATLGTLVGPRWEDRRVTGGLLVLAGASDLWFSLGMARGGSAVIPSGTLALWTLAWWFHWSDLRNALWR